MGDLAGNTWARIENDGTLSGREALHQKLAVIMQVASSNGLLGQLTLNNAADISTADARADFGVFAALCSLSPFVFSGASLAGAVSSAWRPVFSDWDKDRALTDAERNAGKLNYSDEWLADRAAFLTRKVWYNAQNINPFDPAYEFVPGGDLYRNDDREYWDVASGFLISQGLVGNATRRYYFGDDNGNAIEGGGVEDHLYGGGGNDTLTGHSGGDLLEGGKGDDEIRGGDGNDTLVGGDGDDEYIIEGTAGNDIIRDGDDSGSIKINGTVLDGGDYVAPGMWQRNNVTYLFSENADGRGTLTIQSSAGITTVENFKKDGMLGITLATTSEPVPPPVTDHDIAGDLAPKDFDLGTPGVQTQTDEWGNLILAEPEVPAEDREDFLNDTTGNDHLTGLGGSDILNGLRQGDDVFEGGEGRDVIYAGQGDDELFVEARIERPAAIEAAATSLGESTQPGELASGGAGDDYLVGGSDADVLTGGGDKDLIVAGDGADNIWGDANAESISREWALARSVVQDGDSTNYVTELTGGLLVNVAPGAGADDVILAGGGKTQWWRHGAWRTAAANDTCVSRRAA